MGFHTRATTYAEEIAQLEEEISSLPEPTFALGTQVNTFADLPSATGHAGELYIVKQTTGTIFVNRKRAGIYISDGTKWERLGQIVIAAEASPVAGLLPSNPPSGAYVIANIYRNNSGNIEYEYEEEPIA